MANPRVALVTLHRVHNFGSVLQAYATQQILTRAGADVEVVDYWRPTEVPGINAQLEYNYARWNRNPLMRRAFWTLRGRSLAREHTNFNAFATENLALSQSFFSEAELADEHFDADLYCAGSDQIWNSDYHVAGADPFYLSFAPQDAPRFSLASSFGKAVLKPEEATSAQRHLKQFCAVSVREASAVKLLADMDIAATHVIDPTLALEPSKWLPADEADAPTDKYLLVYQLHRSSPLAAVVDRVAKARNLRVVTVQDFWNLQNVRGRNLSNTGVLEFLRLIQNASYIVTDSFHGTAFSLNFGKPFNSVYPENYSERIESLLTKTGARDRAVTSSDGEYSIDDLDADHVERVLVHERSVLDAFLHDALASR